MYASLRAMLMRKLQRANGFSCTLESWTTPFYTDSLMALTGNFLSLFPHKHFTGRFIDASWTLKNVVLCQSPANEAHTGDFIAGILTKML